MEHIAATGYTVTAASKSAPKAEIEPPFHVRSLRGLSASFLLCFLQGRFKRFQLSSMGLPLILFFTILFSTLSTASVAAAETECWELVQNSLIAGKHRITVSPKAFKIQSVGNRYCIISKAPDWKVFVFNRYAKTIYETPAQGFKGNLSAGTGAFGGYLENLPILRRPREKSTYMHLPALVMHIENPNAKREAKRARTFSGVFLNTGEISSADYWMWDNPRINPNFQFVINRLYRLPPGAFPLKLVTVNADRETNTEADTISTRQIPYDEKYFEVPQHFKAVKDEIAVVNDSSRNNAVKNLINNWDNWGKIVETDK